MTASAASLESAILDAPPENWFSAAETAEHLARGIRTIQALCHAGGLRAARVRQEPGWAWYVDPSSLPALRIAAGLPDDPSSSPLADAARLPEAKRDRARGRLAAVQALRDAVGRAMGGRRTTARRAFIAGWNAEGRTPPLSERTLLRWAETYRREGVSGLVDDRDWHGIIEWSPEGIRFIEGLYLREGAQALRSIYRRAEALGVREAWRLPSYRHVCRLMKRLHPAVTACGRDPKRYEDRFLPTCDRDWGLIPAMGCWVGDHRQFDVLVPRRIEDAKGRPQWRWHRPWLTCFLDARSWWPVAWAIAWDGPDGNRTMATFCRGVREHGRPGHAYLDNGKDFTCLKFSGGGRAGGAGRARLARPGEMRIDEGRVRPLLDLLEVGSTFALPFNAKAKIIEPWFRLVAEKFDKTWPTYCGNKTERKPEHIKQLKSRTAADAAAQGYTLEAFAAAFGRWIEEVYAAEESPAEAAKPLTALGAFQELRDPEFTATRPSDPDLALLLMPSLAVCVDANGVYVPQFGGWYSSEGLRDRAGGSGRDAARKVRYRFDPDDPARIWVFSAVDDRFLCEATPYIGGGMHPVAPDGHADRERIGAVMALRRGLAKADRGEVRERRRESNAFLAKFNGLLLADCGAAAQGGAGRARPGATDATHPATDPRPPHLSAEPAQPAIIKLTPFSGVAAVNTSSKFKVQSSKCVAEIDRADPGPVGAGSSALDLLPDEPAAEDVEERNHDRIDDGDDGGAA